MFCLAAADEFSAAGNMMNIHLLRISLETRQHIPMGKSPYYFPYGHKSFKHSHRTMTTKRSVNAIMPGRSPDMHIQV